MSTEPQQTRQPSPALIFDTLNAYQRSQAIKTAVELELFTAIGEGKTTVREIADRCGASERGTRILCDFLTIIGFLTKQDNKYALTPDSAMFVDKRSPACMGTVTEFILSDYIMDTFDRRPETVRSGVGVIDSALEPNHPMRVNFGRAMVPIMALPSQLMAELI